MHSCKSVPIEFHFENKDIAKKIYDDLFKIVTGKIGKCQEISLHCCIHRFGTYDFLALLPKKEGLEVRFALDKTIKSERIIESIRLSKTSYKNCLYLNDTADIDDELLGWITESYSLKDRQK